MSSGKSAEDANVRTIALVIVATAALPLSLWTPNVTSAGGDEQEVCDVGADYSLGIEDYSEAIRRHVEILRHLVAYHSERKSQVIVSEPLSASRRRLKSTIAPKLWD